MIENYSLGHVRISSGNTDSILDAIEIKLKESKQCYLMPLNLTKYVVSKKDSKLRKTINKADFILSDGISIVLLSRRMGYKDVIRITGIGLAEEILSRAGQKKWSLFFLGTSEENLQKAISRLDAKFGKLPVAGFHHGYFSEYEIPNLIKTINRIRPDVLFLGLGMPQKEYFIHDYLESLSVKLCLPVGGSFDVWAGARSRAPQLIQTLGLEWLYRSFYDRKKALNIIRFGLSFFYDLVYKRNT